MVPVLCTRRKRCRIDTTGRSVIILKIDTRSVIILKIHTTGRSVISPNVNHRGEALPAKTSITVRRYNVPSSNTRNSFRRPTLESRLNYWSTWQLRSLLVVCNVNTVVETQRFSDPSTVRRNTVVIVVLSATYL
jgi:hypothetical protein